MIIMSKGSIIACEHPQLPSCFLVNLPEQIESLALASWENIWFHNEIFFKMQPSNTGIEKKIMSDKELEELTSERKQTDTRQWFINNSSMVNSQIHWLAHEWLFSLSIKLWINQSINQFTSKLLANQAAGWGYWSPQTLLDQLPAEGPVPPRSCNVWGVQEMYSRLHQTTVIIDCDDSIARQLSFRQNSLRNIT